MMVVIPFPFSTAMLLFKEIKLLSYPDCVEIREYATKIHNVNLFSVCANVCVAYVCWHVCVRLCVITIESVTNDHFFFVILILSQKNCIVIFFLI